MKRIFMWVLMVYLSHQLVRADVLITGIIHGTLTGGKPKTIELFITGWEDLGQYEIWRSNNGGAFGLGSGSIAGLTGQYENTFVFLVKPDCLTEFQNIFGNTGIYANVIAMGIVTGNGNDGFQIRDTATSTVVDQVWTVDAVYSYQNSYWYRNHGTGPDGAWIITNWYTPGNGALDGLDEAGIRAAVPFGTYSVLWTGPGKPWDDPGNWSSAEIPGINTNVIIPDDTTIEPFVENDPEMPATCMNLYITHDNCLTVNPGSALTVTGNLKLQPGYGTKSGGQLILKSAGNLEPSGSLIVKGTIYGHVLVERYIPKDNSWRFLSSPVDSQMIIPEFVPQPIDLTFDFYKWDPDETMDKGWINIRDSNGMLNPSFESIFSRGRGYLVAYSEANGGDSIRTFIGEPNHGTMEIPMVCNGNFWNLVGNPYPSALDWSSDGILKSPVAASAMYIWDQSLNQGSGGYRAHNGTIGVPSGTTPYIPAAQGFFVRSCQEGSIRINDSVDGSLVHSSQNFYRHLPEIPSDRLRLKLDRNGYSDETLIYFNDEATNDFDIRFDAIKLFAFADSVPEICSMEGSEQPLCINVIHEVPADVYLNIYSAVEDEMLLEAYDFDDLSPDIGIYLEDLELSQVVSLRDEPNYEFHMIQGQIPDRFIVHFISTVNTEKPTIREPFKISSLNDRVIIVNQDHLKGSIILYNLTGQKINSTGLDGSYRQECHYNLLPGIYIISIQAQDYVTYMKVFLE